MDTSTSVNHDQLLRADKALWLRVAEETRAQVQGDGLKRPVDEAIEKWSLHAEIQYHIMPMPSATSSAQTPKATPPAAAPKGVVKDYDTKNTKGKGKGKHKGKITIPEDCEIKFGEHQRPICMKYNVGVCRGNVKPGKRCAYGFHVCWKKKCHKKSLRCGVHHTLKHDRRWPSFTMQDIHFILWSFSLGQGTFQQP